MGKWISSVITALVVLAATSFAGALLKGPIDEIANRDRLKANIQLSPWTEKPDFAQIEKNEEGNKKNNFPEIPSYRSLFSLATVNIENNGSKIVDKISIRIDDEEDLEGVIFTSSGQRIVINDTDKLNIPDMKPGDRASVYLWGTFSSHTFMDEFRTFSSEGSFSKTIDWPSSQEYIYDSWISKFLDQYAWTIFVGVLFVLVAVLGILAASYLEYVKLILVHGKAYQAESKRFWEDPKKFTPDIELTNQRHYQAHALFPVQENSPVTEGERNEDASETQGEKSE
jgi:hypothetical protein